jgi:nitrite reductase (NO-forming)
MFELIGYLWQYLVQAIGLFVAYAFAALFLYLILRKLHSRMLTVVLLVVFLGASLSFYVPNGLPHAFEYPFFLKTYGPATGPVLPFKNVWEFFTHFDRFERVADIARDPAEIPPPITRTQPEKVHIDITSKEVISEMAPGVTINYWTFGGQVPGPFLRVREGDTVELTLHNDPTSLHHHSIDLHAVTGPGGGAVVTMVAPGESKTVTFKALHAGLFVYHCAEPNVANHMTHGMYGLILVEPKEGLPKVDTELYVMQGEFYEGGGLGKHGLQLFDAQAMLDGKPQYIVFNGRTKGLNGKMSADVGQKVRVYVGNGGVNLDSNFHVIGEIFDTVYPEGALRDPIHDVQTTLIPAGGAAAVEFGVRYPGNYAFVDHALARLDRGAWGILSVKGEKDPAIYDGVFDALGNTGGH